GFLHLPPSVSVPLAVTENLPPPTFMDLLSAPFPVSSEPPWPPDLCLVSREASSISAGNLASSMFLHPEVPPLLPLLPLLPSPQILSPPLLAPLAPPASSYSSQVEQKKITRSTSLPNSKFGASSPRSASASLTWIPVVHRTPPARVRTNTSPVRPVTSAQFDSEEELISAAQSILRKRIAAAEAELPPLSTAKDRRRVRQHQRQAMQKICNNLD
ncbi:hypothetical protein HID58_060421, partial [Brassica napus]